MLTTIRNLFDAETWHYGLARDEAAVDRVYNYLEARRRRAEVKRGPSRGETPLGAWLRGLLERAHPNVVVVALAAKLARIAWAVLKSGADYDRGAARA